MSHFHVSSIVWAKSHDSVHKPIFFEEKGEPKRMEPRSLSLSHSVKVAHREVENSLLLFNWRPVNCQGHSRVKPAIKSQVKAWFTVHHSCHLGWLGKNEDKWTKKTDIEKKIQAVDEECKAIHWPIPGWQKETVNSLGFWVQRTLISASLVTHR